jgi:hypothetical protein
VIRVLALLLFCVSAAAQDTVPLREYVDSRFDAQKEQTAIALAAQQEATSKAEVATEKRFESVNEFRAQLADQARTFMPRLEAEQRAAVFEEKIQELTDRVNARDERAAGAGALWVAIGAVIAVCGVVFGIAFPLIKMRTRR